MAVKIQENVICCTPSRSQLDELEKMFSRLTTVESRTIRALEDLTWDERWKLINGDDPLPRCIFTDIYETDVVEVTWELFNTPVFRDHSWAREWIYRSLPRAKRFMVSLKCQIPRWILVIISNIFHGEYSRLESIELDCSENWSITSPGPAAHDLPHLRHFKVRRLNSLGTIHLNAPSLKHYDVDEPSSISFNIRPSPPRDESRLPDTSQRGPQAIDVYYLQRLGPGCTMGAHILRTPTQVVDRLRPLMRAVRSSSKLVPASPLSETDRLYFFMVPGTPEQIMALIRSMKWIMLPVLEYHLVAELKAQHSTWNQKCWTMPMLEIIVHLLSKIWHITDAAIPPLDPSQIFHKSYKNLPKYCIDEEGPIAGIPLIRPDPFQGCDVTGMEIPELYHALAKVCPCGEVGLPPRRKTATRAAK